VQKLATTTLHRTADRLLRAGAELAEQGGLLHMTVDDIVARAGVAKGTFYIHFHDRTAFLVALHRRFHEQVLHSVLAAVAVIAPGGERLQQGAIAYLDQCLQQRAVKALLLEARSEPAIGSEVLARNAEFAQLASADFAALGWPESQASARLYVAMVAEAALMELEAGAAQAPTRTALWQFLGIVRR
jgi:TetR/AcrR family transcriptional repressor of nem operon